MEFYTSVSLVASFPGLDSSLVRPFKKFTIEEDNEGGDGEGASNGDAAPAADAATPPQPTLPILSYAVAIYDFAPTAVNHIALREGNRVAIVSKAGGDRGWWKGQVVPVSRNGSKKIGYFPMNYVREED